MHQPIQHKTDEEIEVMQDYAIFEALLEADAGDFALQTEVNSVFEKWEINK